MPKKPKTNSEKRKDNPAFSFMYKYDDRPNSAVRGYGYKWQKASKCYLAKHPLCADCLAVGRTTAADEVHHIHKVKDNPDKFWVSKYWLALCSTCHKSRTGKGE